MTGISFRMFSDAGSTASAFYYTFSIQCLEIASLTVGKTQVYLLV
jgi:hypothetical protein